MSAIFYSLKVSHSVLTPQKDGLYKSMNIRRLKLFRAILEAANHRVQKFLWPFPFFFLLKWNLNLIHIFPAVKCRRNHLFPFWCICRYFDFYGEWLLLPNFYPASSLFIEILPMHQFGQLMYFCYLFASVSLVSSIVSCAQNIMNICKINEIYQCP